MSPSELLEDPLDFDDVDQALNEKTKVEDEPTLIEGIREELEQVLELVVEITSELSLHLLLDLHFQLSRIIKRYGSTHNRKNLCEVCYCKLLMIFM